MASGLNDKLVTTGNYPFPIQSNHGVVFERDDTTITHSPFNKWLMLVPLSKVGNSTLSTDARVQSAPVRLTCYGHQECSSLTDAGQKIWSRKVPRNISAASKLQILPSTN